MRKINIWTRMLQCFLAVTILWALQNCPCHAQLSSPMTQDIQQQSLGGLTGVTVVIAPFEVSPPSASLNLDLVRTDTELRLRKAGINVVEPEEFGKQPGKLAMLYISLHFVNAVAVGIKTYVIQVGAIQVMTTLRDSPHSPPKMTAITWFKGNFGNVQVEHLEIIRQRVGDLVDEFTSDYMASNPKQGARSKVNMPHTARSPKKLVPTGPA